MSNSDDDADNDAFHFKARAFKRKQQPPSSSEESSSEEDTPPRRSKGKGARQRQQPQASKKRTSATAAKSKTNKSKKSNALEISLLDSSDDSDSDDNCVSYIPVNKTLEKARAARLKLQQSNAKSSLNDSIDEDLTTDNNNNVAEVYKMHASRSVFNERAINLDDDDDIEVVAELPSAGGKKIKLQMRVNGNAKDIVELPISVNDPFQRLMDLFCRRRGVLLSQCKFELDGDALNPKGTCNDEDLVGGEIIEVKVTASEESTASANGRSSNGSSNKNSKKVKLILRVNGNDKDRHIFVVNATDPFQKLKDAFCKKMSVQPNKVRFELDGDALNMNSNCNNEDLVGEEIIEVIM